jgi:hypothetical protein
MDGQRVGQSGRELDAKLRVGDQRQKDFKARDPVDPETQFATVAARSQEEECLPAMWTKWDTISQMADMILQQEEQEQEQELAKLPHVG